MGMPRMSPSSGLLCSALLCFALFCSALFCSAVFRFFCLALLFSVLLCSVCSVRSSLPSCLALLSLLCFFCFALLCSFFSLVWSASAARCYILVAPSRRKICCLPRVLMHGALSFAAARSLEYLEDSPVSGHDIFLSSSPFRSSESGALIRRGSELCHRGRSHSLQGC